MLLFIVRSIPFKVFSVCKAFSYVGARNVPSFRFFFKVFLFDRKNDREKKKQFSIYILAFEVENAYAYAYEPMNHINSGQRNEFYSAYALHIRINSSGYRA